MHPMFASSQARSVAVESTTFDITDPHAAAGAAEHETWLISFIDVLMLLLTVFVLLLAWQKRAPDMVGEARMVAAPVRTMQPQVGEPVAEPVLLAPAAQAPVTLIPVAQPPAVPNTEVASVDMPSAAMEYDWRLDRVSAAATELFAPALRIAARAEVPFAPGAVEASPESPLAANATPAVIAETQAAATADAPATTTPAQDPMQELLASLARHPMQDRFEVDVRPGAVNLEISDSILFTPANAELTAAGRALLDELALAMDTLPFTISVEGHTDDVPIDTARFPSNWELSSARATVVTRYLIGRGIDAARVRAIGYADTRPRADNTTAQGRAKNRRVSFVLQAQAAAVPEVSE